MRRIFLTVLILAIAATGFGYGFYSAYTKNEVYRFVLDAKRAIQPRMGPFNEHDQLVRYAKNEVGCPKQTDKTMVAVVFGQSIAANSGGQRYTGKPNVVNFFGGRCFEASDPLLGNEGIQGTVWTPMANQLGEHYDAVVLIPMALGGSRISEWVGRLDGMLTRNLLAARQSGYGVTHFLWMQGPSDANETRPEAYSAALERLIAKTKEGFPQSKFYVALATYCEPGAEDERIRQAQRKAVDPARNIFEGPNTDLLVAAEDRRDGCHFSGTGQEKIARAWRDILLGHTPAKPTPERDTSPPSTAEPANPDAAPPTAR